MLGAKTAGGLLLLIIGVAFLVRLPGLGTLSITLEEYACIYHLDAPDFLTFIEQQRAHYPYGAPLVPMLQYAWTHAAGNGIAALRALSLIATLLIIPVLYALTRLFFAAPGRGRAAGLIAAVCAALSHVHVYHGQEARMYGFFALFALVSAYGAVRVLQGGPRRWWVLSVCANALVMWTHLFGVLLVAVEAIAFVVTYRREWKAWLGWGLAHLLPLIPLAVWILTIPPQPENLTGYYGAPSASQVFWDVFGDDVVFRASLGFAAPPSRDPAVAWWARSYPVMEWGMALLFIAAALWVLWKFLRERERAPWGFLLLWLLLPITALVVISYAWMPVYSSRYSVHSVYPLYIGLGGLLTLIPRKSVVAIAGAALTVLYAQQLVFAQTRPVRTEWKPVIAELAEGATENDAILVEDFFWLPLFELNNDRVSLPTAAALERDTLRALAADVTRAREDGKQRHAWVVLVNIGRYPPGSFAAALVAAGFHFSQWDYPGERPLELFRIDGAPAGERQANPVPWSQERCARALEGAQNDPRVAALREELYLQPDNVYAPWLRLGLDAGVRGDTVLAAHLLARAAALNPAYALYLALLEEALTGNLPDAARPFVAAAKALEQGDTYGARDRLAGEVASPALTRWLRWRICLAAGNEEAADVIREAMEADALPGKWDVSYGPIAGFSVGGATP